MFRLLSGPWRRAGRKTLSMSAAASLLILAASCQTAAEDGAEGAIPAATRAARNDRQNSQQSPSSGHYVGYVQLTGAQRGSRLAASLELIRTLPEGALRGVLKLSPGGLGSHEYVSTYFPAVRVLAATGQMTFAAGEGPLQLVGASLQHGELTATVKSAAEPAGAPLYLTIASTDAEAATRAQALTLVPATTGTYTGTCDQKPARLELESSRWQAGSDQQALQINGRLSYAGAGPCLETEVCVAESLGTQTYDVLRGEMQFRHGRAKGRSCQVTAAGLDCGTCTFHRDDVPHSVAAVTHDDSIKTRHEHLETTAEPAPAAPTSREGQYYGYLHHEDSGIYQLVALNLKAPQSDSDTADRKDNQDADHAWAIASLYFGEGDSSEFIAYRWQQPTGPAVSHYQPGTVLAGDGEAFFVVSGWDDGQISGVWYSKTFGRVGTVELQQNHVPALSADAKTIDRLGGSYKSDEWDLEITISSGVSESAGDVYPLKVYGWAKEHLTTARRRVIEAGTYDFYSGTLALRLDDGRTALGRLKGSTLELHWPPKPRLGTPLSDEKTLVCHRVVDTYSAGADTHGRW